MSPPRDGPGRLLIVRPGSVYPEIRAAYGDFDRWFVRALAAPERSFDVVDPTMGPLPERLDGYRRVIVTGSLAAAYGSEPWIGELADFLRRVAERDLPMLGVCFGLQILATALGGRVERHPNGPEMGTVSVELTAEGLGDPLFAGFDRIVKAQSLHEDAAFVLPPGAELLASNAHTEVQAFRVGPSIHAVQFHPEITQDLILATIRRAVRVGELDRTTGKKLRREAEPTPDAKNVLRHFHR